jgi:hypothetical protein
MMAILTVTHSAVSVRVTKSMSLMVIYPVTDLATVGNMLRKIFGKRN